MKRTPTLTNDPNFPDFPNDQEKAVNLMITLINQVIYLEARLIESLKNKFIQTGGFRENLFRKRQENRKYDREDKGSYGDRGTKG